MVLNLPELRVLPLDFWRNMKPKKPAAIIQEDFFRLRLDQLLDQRHELYRLATKMVLAELAPSTRRI